MKIETIGNRQCLSIGNVFDLLSMCVALCFYGHLEHALPFLMPSPDTSPDK
jgi:hypothetical protein